jgi:hypothetical protein
MQMVCITQSNLASDISQIKRRETAFDGRLCGDIHKNRRFDVPVCDRQPSAPRTVIDVQK